MAMTVSASIQLNDMMSGPIQHITSAMNIMLDCMSRTDTATDVAFDSNKVYEMRQHIDTVNAELAETEQRLNNVSNKGNGAAKATRDIAEATKQVNTAQRSYNSSLGQTAAISNSIVGNIEKYISMAAVAYGGKKLIGESDTWTNNSARLGLITDNLQQQAVLQERIYRSAKASRGAYSDTVDVVAKLGLLAPDAFGSNEEIVKFTELMNKSFKLSGASQQEKTAAMYQLTQAMASGRLQGDEFRSIIENAPMLANAIAEYTGVGREGLKELSSDGAISAEIIKNSLFSVVDDIEEKFNTLPMTFGDIWTNISSDATMAFAPVSKRLNEMLNGDMGQGLLENIGEALTIIANAVTIIIDGINSTANFIYENWDIIAPILGTIGAILTVYTALKLVKGVIDVCNTLSNIFKIIWATCPTILVIILIIGAFYLLIAVINKVKGTTISATGVIFGVLNYLRQGVIYLGQDIANVFLGAWEVVKTFARNLERAFEISVSNVKKTFFGLGGEVLKIIGWIAQKLNALPFFYFNDEGIMEKADEWAARAAAEQGYRKSYESLADAYKIGASKYNTRPIGWEKQAYSEGYNYAENLFKFEYGRNKEFDLPNDISILVGNTDETAKNTDKTAKNTEKTNSLMELIRDNLEKKAILDYTSSTKAVTYDLSGATNVYHNTNEAFDAVKELANYLRGKEATSAEGI